MPAVTPKDPEAARAADAAATVRMLGPLVFMIVTGGQLLNQSRPLLVNAIAGGNARRGRLKSFACRPACRPFVLYGESRNKYTEAHEKDPTALG
jgi:hypothetical protein